MCHGAPGGERWPTDWQAILPGAAIRLEEQDCLKLGVKNLQEVAGQQVMHGAYNKLRLLGGQSAPSSRVSGGMRELTGCVFLAELEVGVYGKWCASKSKFIHVFIILLDYVRNNHNHKLHLILTLAPRDKIGRSGPVSSFSFYRWGYQGPKMSNVLP